MAWVKKKLDKCLNWPGEFWQAKASRKIVQLHQSSPPLGSARMNNDALIGRTLLAIHTTAESVAFPDFQEAVFTQLQDLLSFNAGIWGMGAMLHGAPQPHHIHLQRLPPDFMASWEPIKSQDILIGQALASGGQPIRSTLSDPAWDQSPGVRRHCARHDIGHVLCVFLADAQLGLYHFISLYRSARETAFSERDERIKQILAPHLVHAVNVSRLRQLRAASTRSGPEHFAVMDGRGVVHQADHGFVDMLRREWAHWCGPELPDAVAATRARPHKWAGAHIAVAATLVKDMYLLSVRAANAADRLTVREQQVAQQFARGKTHKEVAKLLGISPATVRNHLQAIYGKLQIGDKAQLGEHMQCR